MTVLHRDRAAADAAVETLKVYAQPQRLMILSCLLGGERTVSDIDMLTGIGQPALSQQLAELRRAEMVKTRRVAKQVYYDLASAKTGLCVRAMDVLLGNSQDPAGALGSVLSTVSVNLPPESRPAGVARFAKIE